MSWLEFAASVIESVAWPLVAAVVVWLLRGQITAVVEKVSEALTRAGSADLSAEGFGVKAAMAWTAAIDEATDAIEQEDAPPGPVGLPGPQSTPARAEATPGSESDVGDLAMPATIDRGMVLVQVDVLLMELAMGLGSWLVFFDLDHDDLANRLIDAGPDNRRSPDMADLILGAMDRLVSAGRLPAGVVPPYARLLRRLVGVDAVTDAALPSYWRGALSAVASFRSFERVCMQTTFVMGREPITARR